LAAKYIILDAKNKKLRDCRVREICGI
jgi:hypothetical protein